MHICRSGEYPAVAEIMEKSFPASETRSRSGQAALLRRDEYRIYVSRDGAGFIAAWRLADFDFIEHFAVAPEHRCRGLGGSMLRRYMELCGRRVVLEAEPPESGIARRRIGFYRRCGFSVNPYAYEQPPLRGEGKGVPLLILSSGGALTEEEFRRCRDGIMKTAYGCGTFPPGGASL